MFLFERPSFLAMGNFSARAAHLNLIVLLMAAAAPVTPASAERIPSRLMVQPSSIALDGADDQHGFIVTAFLPDGHAIDVTTAARFTSTRPAIVRILKDHACQAVSDGECEIIAEWSSQTARIPAKVSQAGRRSIPAFQGDIIPLLTRYGCNQGGCHGKLAGQNGFRLSLRGYAPDWDHDWLTSEYRSRRIDFGAPGESLLLQKPLAQVPHEGGQRFTEGSRAHRMLLDWISSRAPGLGEAKTNRAETVDVFPASRIARPAESQHLLVTASDARGRRRDVTWLCQFFSNDSSIATVTPEGVVTAVRPGETALRVHFQGEVKTVLFTIPFSNAIEPSLYAKHNNLIDPPVFEKLRGLQIPPSPDCGEAAFLRRAFLDAIGRLPTPAEARAFLSDNRANKRSKIIDELLDRPEFVDYWTLQLCDLMQNRKERDHDVRGAKGVRSFQTWVRRQVAANRPWDEIVRAVLTASGDSVSQPQIGYFVVTVGEHRDPEASEIPSAVAQSFLGVRIGCAKCHNHPLEKFTQDDYYHFAAFFSRLTLDRENPTKSRTLLTSETPEEEREHKHQRELAKKIADLEEALKKAAPAQITAAVLRQRMFAFQKEITDGEHRLARLREQKPGVIQPRTKQFLAPQSLDGVPVAWKPGEDLRIDLANWMTSGENEFFSGNMVNRLWKHFFGVGLVEPEDDLRPSNPPSNPALWRALNREFVSSHFNLRELIRLIMNSRAYQLSSETLPANETETRFFSHAYARRLPAEVLLDCISEATGVPDDFPGYPVGLRAQQLPDPGVRSYFLSLFGRSERVTACACERSGDITLPQLLHLENGDDVLKKIENKEGNLAAWLSRPESERDTIETIFLATVSRLPSQKEASVPLRMILDGQPRAEVLRDLFWALLNTKEFSFNH